ncbi:hypothetical protein G6M50_06080 [Agrobacterium rhizogenes]|nr:hypothetical protein [Rhizobium rhizogenes]NTJ77370.1 hypothetical protein [Rhizobium rhizogenes]
MDKELRKEVRDWKAEVEDRLKALEAAWASQGAASDAPVSESGKGKKSNPEPSSGESA